MMTFLAVSALICLSIVLLVWWVASRIETEAEVGSSAYPMNGGGVGQ